MERALSHVDELKASMTSNVIGVLGTRTVVVDLCEECFEKVGNEHQRTISHCKRCKVSVTHPMQVYNVQERSK